MRCGGLFGVAWLLCSVVGLFMGFCSLGLFVVFWGWWVGGLWWCLLV